LIARRATLLATAALGACALPTRAPPVPQPELNGARILGLDNERFLANALTEGFRREFFEALERRRAYLGLRPNQPIPGGFDFLAVSGGGEDGAFGAGLLTAWPNRPRFDLVTGVSTGALTAPFAFLGPEWDAGLRRVYTEITFADVAERRGVLAALFDDAMTDSAPLFRTISREMDERMMAAIATEYQRGRLLFIGTTNLDTALPVIWNIGAIAASGHPRALDTIRRILLASASIPGAFPPVLFDVELNGMRYQELHVDGGAVAQAFLYPVALGEERRANIAARRPVPPIRAWVIRNGRLDMDWTQTDRRTLSITQRAIATMIAFSGYNDTVRIWLTAERDGVEYRVAWIGNDTGVTYREPFEPAYMRALFEYGQKRMREGTAWQSRPPLG
jgi:predicted acylesterase/phospholipase RssA